MLRELGSGAWCDLLHSSCFWVQEVVGSRASCNLNPEPQALVILRTLERTDRVLTLPKFECGGGWRILRRRCAPFGEPARLEVPGLSAAAASYGWFLTYVSNVGHVDKDSSDSHPTVDGRARSFWKCSIFTLWHSTSFHCGFPVDDQCVYFVLVTYGLHRKNKSTATECSYRVASLCFSS